VNQATMAGGDDGVDMTLLLMTNFIEAIWLLLLLVVEKFADLDFFILFCILAS
jgi:hypothetical protein